MMETLRLTNPLPLEMMYPPSAITTNMANDPKVFETIIFLPRDPIRRKRAIDIWCREKYNKNCCKNLHMTFIINNQFQLNCQWDEKRNSKRTYGYLVTAGSYPIT